jgi:hypothetical protein
MMTLLYILLALFGAAVLAYLIVNKVPKKFHWIFSILFLILIGFLAYLNYESIMEPVRFNKAKKIRYAKVIDNLKMIRDAEIAHKKITGKYTADQAGLVKFVDTARFAITEIKNEVIKVKSGTLELEREIKVIDTVGYRSVKAGFAGRDYQHMFDVPGTSAKFELKVDSVEKVQGIQSPTFEAKIAKDIVLKGLPEKLIKEEKAALGGIEVKGEDLSVGTLTDVKVNGNWPPFYDNKNKENKK